MHTSIYVLIIILQQAKHQFPSNCLPFGITEKYKHSLIYYQGEYVEKTVDLRTYPFADHDTLMEVYTVLLGLPSGALSHPHGLIRPLGMPELKDGRWWKVKLPMGLNQPPSDLPSLRCFLMDILHGLDAPSPERNCASRCPPSKYIEGETLLLVAACCKGSYGNAS